MNLSPLPIQKFFDNNGAPLVGGLLFTYIAGTTTKIATYKDASGGPTNTNPVVLDFRGEANVWLDQSLTYKFVLAPVGDTDPPTRPIWTVDNISAAVTFASLTQQIIGALLWPPTAEEIAAGISIIRSYAYPPYNLLRYAAGDGLTDDTTAIQAVINMVSYGETIFVPALPSNLYFKISDDLSLPIGKSLNIIGESPTNSRIHQVTAGKSIFVSASTFASPAQNMIFRDLYLTAANGLYGMKLRANSRSSVSGVNFDGFVFSSIAACVFVEDTLILSFIDCRFKNSYNGIRSEVSASTAWNGGGCTDCMFEGLTGFGILADYLNGLAFVGCTIEACGLGGVKVYNGGGALAFDGCYFEENKSFGSAGAVPYFDIYIGANSYVNGGSITGCLFNGNNGIARTVDDYVPLRFKFARGWVIEGNMLNTGSNFAAFDASAQIEQTRFGRIGLHTEQGASFDFGAGLTATFYNIPASFSFLTSGNQIERLTRLNGEINQRYNRALEVPINSAAWATAFTGTGAIQAEGKGSYLETGATAGSTASGFIQGLALLAGAGQASIVWTDKEVIFEALVSNISAGTSTGISFLMLSTAAVTANPTTRSMGFKVVQDALWGLVHDGTTLNLVNLNTSLGAGIATYLRCEKIQGTCNWYINGILVGTTSTNVPNSGTTTCFMVNSSANGANAATQRLGVYDLKIWASQ